MVDLPKIPRRIVTTEAPRSRVSGDVVAAPFAMLGDALGTFGRGVEDVGVRLAEDEGRRAVTTGEDGLPKFEPMPAFTGRAGEMYNRVGYAKKTLIFNEQVENTTLENRLKYRGDPESFKEWGKGYIEQLVANEADEKFKDIARAAATNQVQQHYRALAAEKQNLDIESTSEGLKRRQELLESNLAALAQQGGTDTPEFKRMLFDRGAIINERVSNPLYRYSRQQADFDQRLFETKNIAIGLVGDVRRAAESNAVDADGNPVGGLRRAQELADLMLSDPRLNDLTIEQRHHYYRLATAEVRALSVENQVLVNQLNAEGQQWRRAIEKGDVDQEGIRDFLQRASQAKAVRGWTAVTNAIALSDQLRGWFDRLPPQERNRVQLQLEGRLGNLADRIIRAESGDNAFAAATTSTARGLGQFIERTWLSLISRHRPEIAAIANREELLAMRNDPKLSREMVMRNAEENRDLLARAGVRTDDAALYLAHFLGPGDAAKVLKAHSNQPLTELLTPEVLGANPAIFKAVKTVGDLSGWAAKKINVPDIPTEIQTNPAFLNGVRERQRQELNAAYPNIEKRIRQGETLSDEELEQFGSLVFSVGTEEQKNKALDLAVLARAGESISSMSAVQRSNLSLEFSRIFANGSARLESEVGVFARQMNQTISAEYQRDPYEAAVRYGRRQPVAPLDFSNPQTLTAGLRARVEEQEWIKQQEGIGPFSLLRPAEAEALRNTLTHGDAAQAEGALNALSHVSDARALTATLASEPLKAALNGMILTGDARRMSAAFVTLDRLWQTNPQQFEASFGRETFKKLTVWQSNLSYRKPEEIADMLRKAEDPQVRAVREKLLSTFTDEADRLSDKDLLGHFSRKIFGVTYSAAQPASDPIQMQSFRQDFAGIYALLRADGVDQTSATDRAVKWVAQAWGVSPSNGNRLMRRPPEHYLPMVNGTHDWVSKEIRAEIERVLGPQFTVTVGGFRKMKQGVVADRMPDLASPTGGAAQNWNYALVADPQTEGEIARFNQWKAQNPGKTPPKELWPSYQLFVFDKEKRGINLWDPGPDMRREPMPVNSGMQNQQIVRVPRFRWSDTALLAAEAEFPEKRAQSFEKLSRREDAWRLFPTALTAGSVPVRIGQ